MIVSTGDDSHLLRRRVSGAARKQPPPLPAPVGHQHAQPHFRCPLSPNQTALALMMSLAAVAALLAERAFRLSL